MRGRRSGTNTLQAGAVLPIPVAVIVAIALVAGYFLVVLNWNYSTGERAGSTRPGGAAAPGGELI